MNGENLGDWGESSDEAGKQQRSRQTVFFFLCHGMNFELILKIARGSSITYIWNLTYGTNESFHKKETHGLGERACGYQGGGRGSGMDWESGINRCQLLPLKWISNEILLYTTGNYI